MKFLHLVASTTAMLKAHICVKRSEIIGSALYHPDAKDLDFLVLVDWPGESFFLWASKSFGDGWESCSDYDTQDGVWCAIRKGSVNFIVTIDPDWYEKAVLANEVCHALKLMNKEDRKSVYRVIRDGATAEEIHTAAGI